MPLAFRPVPAGLRFAVASLCPGLLTLLAAGVGGGWIWAALLCMTGVVFAVDEAMVPAPAPGVAFPAHHALSLVLAALQVAVLALTLVALTAPAHGAGEKAGLFLAAGLFLGQVGHANAHELIHRQTRGAVRLGTALYVILLFGHHVSAHRLVHHAHVATPQDPNTARPGEGFYRFALRAWIGSFRAGRDAETARRRRAGRRGPHPYAVYIGGAAFCLAMAGWAAGPDGVALYLGLAGFAQSQVLLSDYVQHYGLRRRAGPGGRPVPVGPAHSWNAPHWLSGHMLLHATRHSDHHMHPARAFPTLAIPPPGDAPMLPRSLPAMACLALVPPLWRRSMDRRAAAWRHAAEPPAKPLWQGAAE